MTDDPQPDPLIPRWPAPVELSDSPFLPTLLEMCHGVAALSAALPASVQPDDADVVESADQAIARAREALSACAAMADLLGRCLDECRAGLDKARRLWAFDYERVLGTADDPYLRWRMYCRAYAAMPDDTLRRVAEEDRRSDITVMPHHLMSSWDGNLMLDELSRRLITLLSRHLAGVIQAAHDTALRSKA